MQPTPPSPRATARRSFRETQFEAREEAILSATHRLLADRGYETMAMDDIAAEVGIAKGSLYRHFASKEALAGAVMIGLLRRTRSALHLLPASLDAFGKLEAMLRWTLRERLAGGVPHLPSSSPTLRQALMSNTEYMDLLLELSDAFGQLIVEAKRAGRLNPALRDEFILLSLYARSCDPTLEFMRAGGTMEDETLVEHMVEACFGGLGHPQRG